MLKKLILAGLCLAPASTAMAFEFPGESGMTCGSSFTHISDNITAITMQLRRDGYNVEHVSEWSGCVSAIVRNPDGSSSILLFYPDTLRPVDR